MMQIWMVLGLAVVSEDPQGCRELMAEVGWADDDGEGDARGGT